jgi:hypothetical protein
MTDHFEQAKDKILQESRMNGGVTVDHLFDALIATNADLDEQHQQTLRWHEEVVAMVAAHIDEAKVRDERIAKLEEFAEAGPELVKSYVQGYVDCEHAKRHKEHMDELHSADATFQTRLVWFFASTAGKVVLVAMGIVAGMLLNLIVYGRP